VVLVVLLWPDGLALNRAVVRLYVVLLGRGMPRSVTPEVYAVLLNVLLFVLLGWLGVALLRFPAARVAAALVGFSIAVELFQALPGIGRDPSLLDVACNTLGALLGAWAGSVVRRHPGHGEGAAGDEPGGDQPVDEGRGVGGDRLEG
jgi:hypothetical protein